MTQPANLAERIVIALTGVADMRRQGRNASRMDHTLHP
jgi:hypothetical protein